MGQLRVSASLCKSRPPMNNPCLKGGSLHNFIHCIVILIRRKTFKAKAWDLAGFSVVFRNLCSAVKRDEVPDCFSSAFQKLIWISQAGGAELDSEYWFDFSEHLCRAVQAILTRLGALKLALSQTRNSAWLHHHYFNLKKKRFINLDKKTWLAFRSSGVDV